ncbi:MAG TPA: hypothetical protein VK111_04490 [Virgibacillus sp.]|nr:hypothetical protein [Virgibacillus sp.]
MHDRNDLAMLNERIEQLEEALSRLVRVIAVINQRIPDNHISKRMPDL